MKKLTALTALLISFALIVGACNSNTANENNNNNNNQSATVADPNAPPPVSIDDLEFDDPDEVGEVRSGGIVLGNYTPPGDPITFKMFVANPDQGPAADNKIIKMIEEFTGVSIEFDFLVGELDQLIGVMLASGDYPDLINPGNERGRFIESGALIPLDDLLGNYTNLSNHYGPYMSKIRAVSTDGKAYVMPIWTRYYWYGDDYGEYLDEFNSQAFWIQKDVLADAGYPNPSTLDEYFDIIEAYYNKYPQIDGADTLPFEILAHGDRTWPLFNPPAMLIGAGNDGDLFVNQDTYMAELYQTTEHAKNYYGKLNEVYKKGLISPETFTQNYDQYLAKVAQGRVLGMFDAQWNFQSGEELLTSEGKINRTYVPLGLTYPGYEQGYMNAPTFEGSNGIGITTSCKDVDRALTYLDTLLNEDLQRLLSWGIEGEDYYVTEDGRYMLTPEQKTNWDDPDWRVKNSGDKLRSQLPKIQGMFSDGNASGYGTQPEIKVGAAQPYDVEFFSNYPWTTKTGFMRPTEKADYFPIWEYTMPRGSDARTGLVDIKDAQIRYLPGVIMADDFESAWAEYVAVYDNINHQAYVDEVNKQIAERMGIDR